MPTQDSNGTDESKDVVSETAPQELALDKWRIKSFGARADAERWKDAQAEYSTAYARALRQALPIRVEADRTSAMIYRLRENEVIKVTGRADEPSDEGGLQGYWFEVLTETGIAGWVFSAQIEVFDENKNSLLAEDTADPQLDSFFSGNWRPEGFASMIEDNQFDLTQFSPHFGLFFDQEKQIARIVLPREQNDFPYAEIKRLRRDVYQVGESSLQLSFRDSKSLVAQWSRSGTIKSVVFLNLSEVKIDQVYASEMQRRMGLLRTLRGTSGAMSSGTYGTISLTLDGVFAWQGMQALQPRIIPSSADGTGKVDFGLYTSDSLKERYQGVITFSFSIPGGTENINFLYNVRPEGVQLEHVTRSSIRNLEVLRTELNPTVLFFTY